MYGPHVFLLTKIKPKYSDIMYSLAHFPGPLVCQIRQVPLYCILISIIIFFVVTDDCIPQEDGSCLTEDDMDKKELQQNNEYM